MGIMRGFSVRKHMLVAVLAILGTPVLSESYDCTTTKYGTGGWVSNRIILGLDRKANAGSAFDYFIKETKKAPIPVTLKKRSDTSYQFDWKLRNVKVSSSGSDILSHTVVLNTQAMTFTIRGRLHGYDNLISGSGTCKIIK